MDREEDEESHSGGEEEEAEEDNEQLEEEDDEKDEDLDSINSNNYEDLETFKVNEPLNTEDELTSYCIACSSVIDENLLIKTEELTDDEDGEDNDNNKPEKSVTVNHNQSLTATVEDRELFLSFCGLLGVKISEIKLEKDEEVPSFCQICRNQLTLLLDLRKKLKELERDLQNGIEEFRKMCEKSEEKFEEDEVCSKKKDHKIYWKIRKQICRGDGGALKVKVKDDKLEDQEVLIDAKKNEDLTIRLRKSSRSSTKSTRLQVQRSPSPPPPPPKDDNDTAIKIEPEPELPASKRHDEDDLDLSDILEDSLNSPPAPFEDELENEAMSMSSSSEDYEPPPKKKPAPKTKPKPKTSKKRGRPPTKKDIPSKPSPKRKKNSNNLSSSPSKKSKPSKDKDYAPNDSNSDSEDSLHLLESSLKGRMSTDPSTGHITFLSVSFLPLPNSRYRCLSCDRDTSYHRGSLKKHVITLHTSMFVCQECDQHCPSSKSLLSHIRRVHRGQDRTTVPCPICAKPCSSKRGRMEKHMITHLSAQEKSDALAKGEHLPQWQKSRRHICEICGRGYELRAHLIQHKIREHPENDYSENDKMACKEMCPDCGKLVHKHYLKKHQEFVHGPEGTLKRFSCMLCEKRFAKESDLRKHKDAVHEKLKPWKCEFCPKGFTLKTQLAYHVRTHQNIRPFQCQHCPMAFARKHHLERHLRIYHEPGACPKRKTYVKGPETKIKGGVEGTGSTAAGAGSEGQVQGNIGFGGDGGIGGSGGGGGSDAGNGDGQQQQIMWMGHPS